MGINKHVFIIAEAGVNHNGDVIIAKKLIDAAVDAGADAVKFQTFKTENLVAKDAPKADYQKKSTGNGNQFEMLKRLELSFEDHLSLKKYCDEKGILFLSTPFDFESVDLLEKLDLSMYKISSGEITNIPLLRYIARLKKPMIVSTGMANLSEIERAVNEIKENGNDKIILLHCTSNYPTLYEDVNLNAMLTIKNAFMLPVGYSDHTIGIEVPIAAVSLGAEIIEKHFTLDKTLIGPDHKASLEPQELKRMIQSIRLVETALGNCEKKPTLQESKNKKVSRKSLVAARAIKKGEKFTSESLTVKRPGTGIVPYYYWDYIGQEANKDFDEDEVILE